MPAPRYAKFGDPSSELWHLGGRIPSRPRDRVDYNRRQEPNAANDDAAIHDSAVNHCATCSA